jgi:hypothetical protein
MLPKVSLQRACSPHRVAVNRIPTLTIGGLDLTSDSSNDTEESVPSRPEQSECSFRIILVASRGRTSASRQAGVWEQFAV